MSNPRVSPIALAIQISKAWGPHFPVDVRQIAFELSSKQADPIVKIEGLNLKGAEGLLARNGTSHRWGIAFSTHIREPGKINFTIGHELAHYLCHRADLADRILCSRADMVDFRTPGGKEANIEQEANSFASYLLMPIEDFRKRVDGQRVTIELLKDCAERYDTTVSATALKLVDFTDQPVVVVSSEDRRVRWAWSSASAFQMGFYFRKGATIPAMSATAQCFESGPSANVERGVSSPAPMWSSVADVLESAIAQPFYKSVFTVLHVTQSAPTNVTLDEEPVQDSYDVQPSPFDPSDIRKRSKQSEN